MPGQGGWPPGVSGGLTRSSREGAEGRARGPGTGRGAGGAGAQQDLSVQVQERQQEDRGGWPAASVSVPPPALTPARPSTQRARRRRRDRARRMGGLEWGDGSWEWGDARPKGSGLFLGGFVEFLEELGGVLFVVLEAGFAAEAEFAAFGDETDGFFGVQFFVGDDAAGERVGLHGFPGGFDLGEVRLLVLFEVLGAAFAAELDFLIAGGENHGIAHGAEFFAGDDAGVHRVGLHLELEGFVGGEGPCGEGGDEGGDEGQCADLHGLGTGVALDCFGPDEAFYAVQGGFPPVIFAWEG